MAAPNLISLTSVYVKTAILVVTTTMTDAIAAVAAGSAVNIEAIYAANVNDTTAGEVTIVLKRSGTEYKLTNKKRVPATETYNPLLGKPLYLEEGDSLRAQAVADSTVILLIPYSLLT